MRVEAQVEVRLTLTEREGQGPPSYSESLVAATAAFRCLAEKLVEQGLNISQVGEAARSIGSLCLRVAKGDSDWEGRNPKRAKREERRHGGQ